MAFELHYGRRVGVSEPAQHPSAALELLLEDHPSGPLGLPTRLRGLLLERLLALKVPHEAWEAGVRGRGARDRLNLLQSLRHGGAVDLQVLLGVQRRGGALEPPRDLRHRPQDLLASFVRLQALGKNHPGGAEAVEPLDWHGYNCRAGALARGLYRQRLRAALELALPAQPDRAGVAAHQHVQHYARGGVAALALGQAAVGHQDAPCGVILPEHRCGGLWTEAQDGHEASRLQEVQTGLRRLEEAATLFPQARDVPREGHEMGDPVLHVERLGLFLELQCEALHLREGAVGLELAVRLADEGLRLGPLRPHEVDYHVVAEVKARVERVRRALNHPPGYSGFHLRVQHQDDDPPVVQAPPPRPPAHLDVLAPGDPPEALAVELARAGEHDRLRRHVQARREGFSREKALQQALLEQHLHGLLQDGQQPGVVDADAAPQQGQHAHDLGQPPVLPGEALHGVAEDAVDQLLLLVRVQVQGGHIHRKTLHLDLGEGEDDHGVETALHDELDDLVDVRLAVFFGTTA